MFCVNFQELAVIGGFQCGTYRTYTQTGPKKRTCPGKPGRMVTQVARQ